MTFTSRKRVSCKHGIWSRSIISWNIASIHILPPPGYAQMHSPSFPARQTEIQGFLKLWASAETSETFMLVHGNRCSRKGLGRRCKFKPDEGTEGKFDTFNAPRVQTISEFRPERRNLTQISDHVKITTPHPPRVSYTLHKNIQCKVYDTHFLWS